MADMSGDGVATAAVVGVGGFVVIRKVLQYRRRAVNPDMKDPAPSFRFRGHLMLAAFAVVLLFLAVKISSAWDGLGLYASILLLTVTVVGVLVGIVAVWMMAENRRHATGYVICEAQYLEAPGKVKATMRRIYRAARSVRIGHAYQAGMLTGTELDRLVYGAAQRALVSAELSSAVDAQHDDRGALAAANAKLREIQDHLIEVEKSLTRSSKTAAELSRRMAAPEQKRDREQRIRRREDEAAQRRDAARARLDDVAVRAATVESNLDAHALEDRITAVHEGYEEAVTLSQGLIGAPRPLLKPKSDANSDPANTRDDVAKVAKSSAAQAKKLSGAATKWGAERLAELEEKRAAKRAAEANIAAVEKQISAARETHKDFVATKNCVENFLTPNPVAEVDSEPKITREDVAQAAKASAARAKRLSAAAAKWGGLTPIG